MGGRGKVVRNAAIFGHHKIINSMRRTQSIGLDIEKEGERCQKGPNPEHSKCCPEGAFRHPMFGPPRITSGSSREEIFQPVQVVFPLRLECKCNLSFSKPLVILSVVFQGCH